MSDTPCARDASNLPLLDRAYLARFTMGNIDLEREVLGLFAAQAPSYYARMLDAASLQDWREAAHTLKGSAGAVGAVKVAKLAEAIERVEPPPVGDERRSLCGDLARAIDATRAEISTVSA